MAAAIAGALVAGAPSTGPYAAAKPELTPPLWLWLSIALAYYVAMTVCLVRLHRAGDRVALSGVLAVLLLNEAWNVFLFRLGRADLALYALLPFLALVLTTAWLAWRADRLSATLLITSPAG